MTSHAPKEISLLAGKVIKKSLPLLAPPAGADAPLLKRLALPQGELAQFYDSDRGIRYMAFIELLPGKPRGNHYHRAKEELLYIITGRIELVLEDVETKARETAILEPGDLAVIQTGIAHALRPVEKGSAIEFSPTRFDLADIQRYPLI